ncbi:MAG: DUF1614 domain-containing protein [Candidatus Omnitrophica bacterium]|nr:DUF1614 domain-containing protein [Candidatus Omnitrophota bacterium]
MVTLIEIGILEYAFESMGINRRYMFLLLVFCLLGSYINIPVAELQVQQVHSGEIVTYFGMQYVVPMVVNRPETIIAVNIGGAVIPFVLSIYLIAKHGQYLKSFIAIGIVTIVVHLLARPVPGVGIAVPTFAPPIITALVVVMLCRRRAAPLAYIAGSLGTLIGADLLNLDKVRNLGAPVASIGGAGKFDGIFLTGILAVLLASLLSGPSVESKVEQ